MNRRGALLSLTSVSVASGASAGVMDWYNGVRVGSRLPEHDAEFLGSQADSGFKLLLVDFWATWCAPCREEFPHLNSLHARFAAQGLSVIGLTRESRPVVEPFLARVQINYPIGVGGQKPLQQALGIKALPYALLADRSRTIVWRGQASSLSADEVSRRLQGTA